MTKADPPSDRDRRRERFHEEIRQSIPGLFDLLSSFRPVVSVPRFTLKQIRCLHPGITYRSINEWESRSLIGPHRDKRNSGWRRFSIQETILLLIIADLKAVGVPSDRIGKLVQKLYSHQAKEKGTRLFDSLLEFLVLRAFAGVYTCLPMLVDGTVITEFPEVFITHLLVQKKKYGMFVYIPFSDYVERVFETLDLPISTAPLDRTFLLDPKIRHAVKIILRDDYEKIELTRRNGQEIKVKGIRSRQGKFEAHDIALALASAAFQTVRVTQKNGVTVAIEQEEILRPGD